MERKYWLERWQRRELGFHQQHVNRHLESFWERVGRRGDGPVLVPLCGKSLDLLWLRAQGLSVVGVELSPLAVEEFFSENRLEARVDQYGPFRRWSCDGITLLQGDLFELVAPLVADEPPCAIYDRASLVALPPEMRIRYASFVASHFAVAPVLLVSMEYDQRCKEGPPFSVEASEVERLYSEHYHIEPLYQREIIDENPRYRGFGIESLREVVYRLEPRS